MRHSLQHELCSSIPSHLVQLPDRENGTNNEACICRRFKNFHRPNQIHSSGDGIAFPPLRSFLLSCFEHHGAHAARGLPDLPTAKDGRTFLTIKELQNQRLFFTPSRKFRTSSMYPTRSSHNVAWDHFSKMTSFEPLMPR